MKPKNPDAASPLAWQPEPETWALAELDLEPEQCWCLRCGSELPCPCSTATNSANDYRKEVSSHV